MVPSLPTPLPHVSQPPPSPPPSAFSSTSPTAIVPTPEVMNTEPNSFGLFWQYSHFPQNDPEDYHPPGYYCQGPNYATASDKQEQCWWSGLGHSQTSNPTSSFALFLNATVYHLMNWFYSGSFKKTLSDLDHLVRDVILTPDFKTEDLQDFSASHEAKHMDAAADMAVNDGAVLSSTGGVLLATIRSLGGCLCPRCKITKDQISGLGTAADHKLSKIFKDRKGPNSSVVQGILKPLSMVPTWNAFSVCLFHLGFDYHRMFVPDLLHEFELRTWKATFTHLIRILHALGDGPVQEMNRRYCSVLTFGQNTICHFSTDVSAIKKLAGQDFEDLLQCAIPVFEQLLPAPHTELVLDLLFILGRWHALAKLGELEHQYVKKFYTCTNKHAIFTHQIAKHEWWKHLLQQIQMHNTSSQARTTEIWNSKLHIPFGSSEPLGPTPPGAHYHLSQSHSFLLNITTWLMENYDDPATKKFLPKLKDHLLCQLEGAVPGTQTYTTAKHNRLHFAGNCIYQHKYLHINYTSYDIQRAQDSVNPRTHSDIMVLAGSNADSSDPSAGDDHPYLYAHVLGIFYAEVQWHKIAGNCQEIVTRSMDFLWVCWFVCDTSYPCNLGHKWLPCLEFTTDGAFGFLDPEAILRSCHLIPAYAHGHVSWLGSSMIYPSNDHHDWRYHYANIFVDRDMFMRYQGEAVGHGRLGPATNRSSFTQDKEHLGELVESSEDETPEEEILEEGTGWQESSADVVDLNEADDYGYGDSVELRSTLHYSQLLESESDSSDFAIDNMDEDGEGQWDSNRPENDGYRSFN
ncbi:hypothetical protein AN958_03356 [Leucoagaricus sp. SymC.cos]|nr:hypothetical protein AN958_03356 [Leucoagaricus sp. SymC.cos]